MNYTPIEELKHAWVFKRKDLPITAKDLANIKPMASARAATLWATSISNNADHPDFFTDKDWVFQPSTWSDSSRWEEIWDSDEPAMPSILAAHLDWQDNTTVYFCLSKKVVIETTWAIFKRCWKNFLMMDDGPVLFAKKRKEVAQFLSDGSFKIGLKP
jgi:hypothetical protein